MNAPCEEMSQKLEINRILRVLLTLMNGKSEIRASFAASAVLPEFGGPSNRTDTKPT